MDHPLRGLSLDELRRRTSVKWRTHPEDVLPLFVAEMDVLLAEPVVRAVRAALESGDTGYLAGTEYAEAYAEVADQRWGWQLDPAQTRLVPDVMRGVAEVLMLLTQPGDSVVINPPVYPPFAAGVRRLGREVIEAPLGPEGRLDLTVLEATLRGLRETGGRATYLLCSPHNPTGTVHTREELTAVGEVTRAYGVRVVVDEIHAPLVHAGSEFVPFVTVPGAEDAISLVSASKAWNLAGLPCALAVAGPEAVDDLARMPLEAQHGVSHLGSIAHVAALREGSGWLDALLVDLAENRLLLGDLLAERLPEVGYTPPEGTYLAWLDCRRLGLGDDPAAAFLDRGRVALVSGPTFGSGGDGHVRLNLATTPEILREAVERMARAV